MLITLTDSKTTAVIDSTGAQLISLKDPSGREYIWQRAPKFWTDHGLEWFYRLCKEPRRIGRMMKLPLFLIHVKQEKRHR